VSAFPYDSLYDWVVVPLVRSHGYLVCRWYGRPSIRPSIWVRRYRVLWGSFQNDEGWKRVIAALSSQNRPPSAATLRHSAETLRSEPSFSRSLTVSLCVHVMARRFDLKDLVNGLGKATWAAMHDSDRGARVVSDDAGGTFTVHYSDTPTPYDDARDDIMPFPRGGLSVRASTCAIAARMYHDLGVRKGGHTPPLQLDRPVCFQITLVSARATASHSTAIVVTQRSSNVVDVAYVDPNGAGETTAGILWLLADKLVGLLRKAEVRAEPVPWTRQWNYDGVCHAWTAAIVTQLVLRWHLAITGDGVVPATYDDALIAPQDGETVQQRLERLQAGHAALHAALG